MKLSALPLLAGAGAFLLAHAHTPPVDLFTFEERFIDTLPYADPSNHTVTLVGYKKIMIPAEHVRPFEDDYYRDVQAWGHNRVYDPEQRAVRVYFPVEGALLEHDGARVEADSLGQLPGIEQLAGDCRVVGRKKTRYVSGVDGNVIKDGVIYLARPAAPVRRVGNTFVYDFGVKEIHDHHDHGLRRARRAEGKGKGSCIGNHNGINCSRAYGINKGRCSFNPKVCMDYNGVVTDCKNHSGGWKKYRNFVGSDCDVSLGKGHCWNEIM